MSKKRLNDTITLSVSPLDGGSQSMDVNVRKIDNGYLTRTSHCDPVNGYHSVERFSKEKPDLSAVYGASKGASPDAGNSMAKAKAYLGAR